MNCRGHASYFDYAAVRATDQTFLELEIEIFLGLKPALEIMFVAAGQVENNHAGWMMKMNSGLSWRVCLVRLFPRMNVREFTR